MGAIGCNCSHKEGTSEVNVENFFILLDESRIK